MVDPVAAIQNVYMISVMIYYQVQLVEINQKQSKNLRERVRIIEAAIHGLEKIRHKNQHQSELNGLRNTLKAIFEFIKKITASNPWARWILKTVNYQNRLIGFTDCFEKTLSQGFPLSEMYCRSL